MTLYRHFWLCGYAPWPALRDLLAEGQHLVHARAGLEPGARSFSSFFEGVTPGLKIATNSTPTHFFGTRYPIECQKVSYTLYIVSKSVIYALYSVKKCLIHSINCYFQSWCFSLPGGDGAPRPAAALELLLLVPQPAF